MEVVNPCAETASMLLTVCVITYNHDQYIENALKGVLEQKTSFPFNIVVADDCSTDNTRVILREYAARHPQITLLFQETNQGPAQNFYDLIYYPKSEYIAYTEGDDFWSNPQKLQLQVASLISNPSASFSFTNVEVIFETERQNHVYQQMNDYPTTILLADYLENYYPIPMFTKVFRRSILPDYRTSDWNWMRKVQFADNAMHMLDLMKGPATYVSEVCGNYRVHSQSQTRQAKKDNRWYIEEILFSHYHFVGLSPKNYKAKFKAIRALHFEKLLDHSIASKKPTQTVKDLIRYIADGRSGNFGNKVLSIIKTFKKHLGHHQAA